MNNPDNCKGETESSFDEGAKRVIRIVKLDRINFHANLFYAETKKKFYYIPFAFLQCWIHFLGLLLLKVKYFFFVVILSQFRFSPSELPHKIELTIRHETSKSLVPNSNLMYLFCLDTINPGKMQGVLFNWIVFAIEQMDISWLSMLITLAKTFMKFQCKCQLSRIVH